MPLTNIVVDETSPRGGPPGTVATLSGSGFLATQGLVIFDPLGQAIAAAITTWDPLQVVFTVPTLPTPLSNQFVTVHVQLFDGSDGYTFRWWSPEPGFDAASPHPKVGYQLPSAEAGSATQDEDDPEISSAADFNRLLGIASTAAGGGGPFPLAGDVTGNTAASVVSTVGGETAAAVAAAAADVGNPRPPSGAAGGDLTGTYPNPTLATPHYTDQQAAFAAQVFA